MALVDQPYRMNSARRFVLTLNRFPAPQASDSMELPRYEFHIHKTVREMYGFDQTLFSITGNVVFANFHAVRIFADKMIARRNATTHPEKAIRPGHLNAMGLVDEIYHHILRLYEETTNPKVFARACAYLNHELGNDGVRTLCRKFVELFPSSSLYRKEINVDDYLAGSTNGKPNEEIVLEELILLSFANFNPAFAPFKELFDDEELQEPTVYTRAIAGLERFFLQEKTFGPDNQHIFDLLRAPILANPLSLEGQLAYIRQRWGMILSEKFLQRMLSAGDFIKEDMRKVLPGAEAQSVVPTYRRETMSGTEPPDYERFSTDLEWMPKVVILAKNIYVWLDQLSRKYQRSITKLHEIPDEELDRLARWNFCGLWLIGIWERSRASQRIKQMMGNPEAVASAYSLYDYEIAEDLGGEQAFQDFRRRAWEKGIRLAGDMVPNHVGIHSRWVIEHPEYFIQSNSPPFPGYRFTGENLSDDSRVEIRIEDGYWNRSDAAVVFQRIDTWTGDVRYLYHGNDGTSMPWNDTAQLDFLREEVREAVMQMIFHVARKFPIIRFDAAMVLAKKHFQRLWYPQPGTGGAIPSRSDHALPSEDFERAFPREFWREVVDRINAEMPNTLLLAEAFWLLEGYFVRTLGMHRVYNSAFMHMLMKEENPKYRELIRVTLHYNPEILKRYVNFMSNPDEHTAVEQFGKGDKYFGVAVLMVTLPGLPMFAHGQIEGLKEKYGMEYRRAYYDERPDEDLVARHEREIFPLMAKRHLFSQVSDFELYDFIDTHGNLNENVFVYSNMTGTERAVVCYHNTYAETAGWVKLSVGKTISATDDPNAVIRTKTLADALQLKRDDGVFYIFRDMKANIEFVRSGRDLHDRGIYLELKAFQYHVFLDFREVIDATGEYWQLAQHLQGRGVQSVDDELRDLRLAPVHDAITAMLSDDAVREFAEAVTSNQATKPGESQAQALINRFKNLLRQIEIVQRIPLPVAAILERVERDMIGIRKVNELLADHSSAGKIPEWVRVSDIAVDNPLDKRRTFIVLLTWLIARHIIDTDGMRLFDTLAIDRAFERIFGQKGDNFFSPHLVRLLTVEPNPFSSATTSETVRGFLTVIDRRDTQEFLHVHTHQAIAYFNKEMFEQMLEWMATAGVISRSVEEKTTRSTVKRDILAIGKIVRVLRQKAHDSGYKLEELRSLLRQDRQTLHAETEPY